MIEKFINEFQNKLRESYFGIGKENQFRIRSYRKVPDKNLKDKIRENIILSFVNEPLYFVVQYYLSIEFSICYILRW